MLIKPNAIFGIVKEDELITSGQIEWVADTLYDLHIRFLPETDEAIEILEVNEKSVILEGDTMTLWGFCCDNFNTHFKKNTF